MKRKFGTACMVIGAVLILCALSLLIYNLVEDSKAGESTDILLPAVKQEVIERTEPTAPILPSQEPEDTEMPEIEINGYRYIGYVSIPALDLELPVMSDWSYEQLKVSPCRYCGSTKTDDLVIFAHNYKRHFGNLKNLSEGDRVYFTDADGEINIYEVVNIETLAPTAIEEMTDSGYDLTLFTCTYGGRTRVTVRCERVED